MMKYSIISNNCVGARSYEWENEPFDNPFIWNCIKLKSFIYLIKNFDTINLDNIKTMFTSGEIYNPKSPNNCVTILVDNTIKLYFIHHHYNQNHPSKKVFRNKESEENYNNKLFESVEYDIEGNDILTYMEKSYNRRLYRMKQSNKPKVFVYWDSPTYNNDDIKKLFSLNTNSHIIVISDTDYSELEDSMHHWLKKNNMNSKFMGKLLNKYIEDNL